MAHVSRPVPIPDCHVGELPTVCHPAGSGRSPEVGDSGFHCVDGDGCNGCGDCRCDQVGLAVRRPTSGLPFDVGGEGGGRLARYFCVLWVFCGLTPSNCLPKTCSTSPSDRWLLHPDGVSPVPRHLRGLARRLLLRELQALQRREAAHLVQVQGRVQLLPGMHLRRG